ncbi:carboxypeptidase-like regulatory domain-containing protein [Engelhardtia mirabilis]|uniref:Uncharacterized protein n=1 Tax=Engelhardtia mirabilis TaxID=2528011 RepID=A0A518BHZ7_9BACT|nr:hypothetical protein Pla133_16830 [Planctomycetes bacterium Pla133]QDV00933.1 hypothetical protein Pla86_16820 [Planctomycetes bacterium Pla86]
MSSRAVLVAFALALGIAVLLLAGRGPSEEVPTGPGLEAAPPVASGTAALAELRERAASEAVGERRALAEHSPQAVPAGEVRLRFRLVDSLGEPLAAASVDLRAWPRGGGPAEDLRAVLEGDGEYSVRVDRRFERVECTARAPGRLSVLFVASPPAQEAEHSFELKLVPAAIVLFSIVDAEGQPIDRAQVSATATGSPSEDELKLSVVDAEGLLKGVGGEHVRLEVASPRHGRVVQWIDLPFDSEPLFLGPIAIGGGQRLDGRLTVDGGTPLAFVGVTVRASSGATMAGLVEATTRTDGHGRFTFANLADANFRLTVDPQVDPLGLMDADVTPSTEPVVVNRSACILQVIGVDRIGNRLQLQRVSLAETAQGANLADQSSAPDYIGQVNFVLPLDSRWFLRGRVEPAGDMRREPGAFQELSGEVEIHAESQLEHVLRFEDGDLSAAVEFSVERNGEVGPLELTVAFEADDGHSLSRTGRIGAEASTLRFRDLPAGAWRWTARVVGADGSPLSASPRPSQSWASSRPLPRELRLEAGLVSTAWLNLSREERLQIDLTAVPRESAGVPVQVSVERIDGDRAGLQQLAFSTAHTFALTVASDGGDPARGLLTTGQLWQTRTPLAVGLYRVRLEQADREPLELEVDLGDGRFPRVEPGDWLLPDGR